MIISNFKKVFETYRAVLIEVKPNTMVWLPKTNLDIINNQVYNKSALWADLNTKNEISDNDKLDFSFWNGFKFKFIDENKKEIKSVVWNKDQKWSDVLKELN